MNERKIAQLQCLHKQAGSSKAIVLLHGYGANMHDLSGIADFLYPQSQIDWFFPDAPLEIPLGFYVGKAWFPIEVGRYQSAIDQDRFEDIKNHKPEGLTKAMNQLHEFLEEIKDHYQQVILGGFSQGSMLCLEYCFNQNPKIDGLLLLSSSIIHQQYWLKNKFNSLPIFQSHGKQDEILPFAIAQELRELLLKDGHQVEFHDFQGGHEIPQQILAKMKSYINLRLNIQELQ